MSDPDKNELVKFCDERRDFYDKMSDNEWNFVRESAIYYFAVLNHGGQWSNLYSVLSTSEYCPGMIETFDGWSNNCFDGRMLYDEMKFEYIFKGYIK